MQGDHWSDRGVAQEIPKNTGNIIGPERIKRLQEESKQRATERELAELAKPKKQKKSTNKPDYSRPETGSAPHAAYRCCSDIKPERIDWLWPGRIVSGAFNLIAGNPGLGKGQITCSMASIVTRCGTWPIDGSRCERGSVIMICPEDSAATTIVPRLTAAGADLDRCVILDSVNAKDKTGALINRPFHLSDLDRLYEVVQQVGEVRLIMIDPLTSHMGGINSYRNTDVRSLLSPLAQFADYCNIAIVGISHLNKTVLQGALQRVGGSGAIAEVARAVWLLEKDKANPSRRYMLPGKNNLAKDTGGLAFSFESVSLPIPSPKVTQLLHESCRFPQLGKSCRRL
ncbi:MAG: AAA family ATPase, partial [Candidatus Methylumidiphilus sp.]